MTPGVWTLSGFRGRLLLQALVTAALALIGRAASPGWTVTSLVVAAGAVFVSLAMRPEPTWRWSAVGFEALAVGYGLVALVSGHWVPGTLVAGWTLLQLLRPEGAAAFVGTPTWSPPVPVPAYDAVEPQVLPDLPPAIPVQPPAPRSAALTVLPGR